MTNQGGLSSTALQDSTGQSGRAPTLDVVIPVFNEEAALSRNVKVLHDFLTDGFPFAWRVTIVDNASNDHTSEIAAQLASTLDRVAVIHLDQKGRGLALRTAWLQSDAEVVAYMDVDLSTGLDALLPLVAPLVSGHSDIAIGSRLAAGANVARGPKREVISRCYNLILRGVFANRFHDAQCGFKALRADVARQLLAQVEDDAWFFDTELLLVAEHNGLRIHELPVDWIDDPDSRVDIAQTARDDLKGSARVAWRFATGRAVIEFGDRSRQRFGDDLGRRKVVFALVGVVSTVVSLVVFLLLRSTVGPYIAVVIALLVTSVANSWAHRRWTFVRRGRGGLAGHMAATVGLVAGSIALSLGALAGAASLDGGIVVELVALTAAWAVMSFARYELLGQASRGQLPANHISTFDPAPTEHAE